MAGTAAEKRSDVEELRARVAELERELAERTERANAAVAAAEDRLYWLERWHIDLNDLFQRPAGRWVIAFLENVRRVRRLVRRIRHRLTR